MEGYEGGPGARYRIAIVDDEYLVRKSLRKMLEEMVSTYKRRRGSG